MGAPAGNRERRSGTKTRNNNLYFEVEVLCAKLGYLGSGSERYLPYLFAFLR